MKKWLVVLILAAIVACGALRKWGLTPSQKEDIAQLDLDALIAQSKLPDVTGRNGECDALLFMGLRHYAISKLGKIDNFDFAAALPDFVVNGEIFRTTDHEACFNTSRDMVLGLLLALTRLPLEAATPILVSVPEYWRTHNWHITESCGDKDCDARRIALPNLLYLWGRVMAYRGLAVPSYLEVPSAVSFPVPRPGFEQHLQAVELAILMEIGEFREPHLLAGKALADSQHQNAVFRAISGDREKAYDLLDSQFPDGARPEYCQDYIYQRADSEAYEVCPGRDPGFTYIDYLFALALCKGDYKGFPLRR